MKLKEITQKEVKRLLTGKNGISRSKDAHKGDFGKVLIAAGSKGMAGAAILCSKAAIRAGSGLVILSIEEDLLGILQTAVPEAICKARMTDQEFEKMDEAYAFEGHLLHPNSEYFDVFYLTERQFDTHKAIAVGPGLGMSEISRHVVVQVLSSYFNNLVLDADALNLIAEHEISLERWDGDACVITPHPGEASRLLGISGADVQADRPAAAKALTDKYGCITVLKGAGTLIAAPGENDIFINTTGNPGMATGGSGDVLCGLIASLLGQGMPPVSAAMAGVYIHGLAGDLMKKTFGEVGLSSSDLPIGIALAMKELMEL